MVEEPSEIGRGQVMVGLVNNGKKFELDALWNREPMQIPEDWGDVMARGLQVRKEEQSSECIGVC